MHGSGEVEENRRQDQRHRKRGDGGGIRRDGLALTDAVIMHGHMQTWVGEKKRTQNVLRIRLRI